MFEFDPAGRYLMPAHFGSPKIEGEPSGWYHDVTTMNVSYVTDRDKLAAHLPKPFSVADEAIITITYARSRDIDWLARRWRLRARRSPGTRDSVGCACPPAASRRHRPGRRE